jgi:hypothetical protein
MPLQYDNDTKKFQIKDYNKIKIKCVELPQACFKKNIIIGVNILITL